VEDDVALSLNVDDDGGHYCDCVECGAFKYPQKVNDACCNIAAGMGELGELGCRAGDYDPHCVAMVVVEFVANAVLEMIEPIVRLH
jgi:hypothetical protein